MEATGILARPSERGFIPASAADRRSAWYTLFSHEASLEANVRAPRLTRFVGPDKPLVEAGERHIRYSLLQRSRVQSTSQVPTGRDGKAPPGCLVGTSACAAWGLEGAIPWIEVSRSSLVQIAKLRLLVPACALADLVCFGLFVGVM